MTTHETESPENQQTEKEEPPPFMRTWKRIYITIALYTCALILALYLITVILNS